MDADQIKRVYNRAYDIAFTDGAGPTERMQTGILAVAEWARKQTLEEAAQIAHMVHYAAECSTDGMLGVGMQARSNAAFEIRNAIRALGSSTGDN